MNNRLKQTMFYTAGTWATEARPELLEIPEVYSLVLQLEQAHSALLERLEEEM